MILLLHVMAYLEPLHVGLNNSVPAFSSSQQTQLALVLPLCIACKGALSELERLQNLMMKWRQFSPCGKAGADVSRECGGSTVATPAHSWTFLLYFDVYNRDIGLAFSRVVRRHEAISKCFRNISEVPGGLLPSEGGYPQGPNSMFYRLALAFIDTQRYHYFLLLETDVFPLRRGWLYHVASLVPPQASRFFWKGSAPRSTCEECFQRPHINGNALYNARDVGFRKHVEWARKTYPNSPFDFALWQQVCTVAPVAGATAPVVSCDHELTHLSVFSDFIVNYYSPVSVREAVQRFPCTVLLHGNRSFMTKPKGVSGTELSHTSFNDGLRPADQFTAVHSSGIGGIQSTPMCAAGLAGVRSLNNTGRACCFASCGRCGGVGCELRQGGSHGCCSTRIMNAGRLCGASQAAPCVLPHRRSQRHTTKTKSRGKGFDMGIPVLGVL